MIIKLFFKDILNLNDLNIAYFILSIIYLFVFSKKIKLNINPQNKNLEITNNLLSLLFLSMIIFNCFISQYVKLILLILLFIFYNKFICSNYFKLSFIISLLYWSFCSISITAFSFINPNHYNINIKSFLYQIMIITSVLITLYYFIIPLIKSDLLIKLCYPSNIYLSILFIILNVFLICLLILTYYINFALHITQIKFIEILFLCLILYLLYFIYLLTIKLKSYKIIKDIEETLNDDLILASSAKREDKIIKQINNNARRYSSFIKANVFKDNFKPNNNEIYYQFEKSLINFYNEYYSSSEIVNEIMCEKHLICDELDITLLANIIKVDCSNVDLDKLKYYSAILSMAIDIIIININNQLLKTKYIVINILNFSNNLSLQIISNNDKYKDRKNKIFDKNKILNSNKYQYLTLIVKQYNGKIKLNIDQETLALNIFCN